MAQAITQVQPSLKFIAPQFNPTLQSVIRLALPWVARYRAHLDPIQVANPDRLVKLYDQFQRREARFLIAFRHPSVNDPFCLTHLLYQSVPQTARQMGVKLCHPVHGHFIYDRGIPLWAGQWMGWLYSQLGGIPILRGKVDRQGLKTARELFVNGQFPLVAAPEGATNGHGEVISPLEPGIAQMGFWCVEDLAKAGRSEQVFIVPVGIQYHYVTPPWDALAILIGELEVTAGLEQQSVPLGPEPEKALYPRLYRLGEHLLTEMERFYQRFYRASVAAPESAIDAATVATRLQNLLDMALQVSEQYFALTPKGSVIDRCRRLEQAGWDWIYRDDFDNLAQISDLERGLADVVAAEASLRMWHMRIVESFVAVTGKYVSEKPTAERFAETTLLIWDLLTRIQGEQPHLNRPVLGKQWAQVTVGEPISVSDRGADYQRDRRSAKQAVAELTQDLQDALSAMITEEPVKPATE
jgi:1-acyl-sn-glycerol-3-phosphate acyltransferase